MTGWCIFLAVCCVIGAANSVTTPMAGVWLTAGLAFAAVGAMS